MIRETHYITIKVELCKYIIFRMVVGIALRMVIVQFRSIWEDSVRALHSGLLWRCITFRVTAKCIKIPVKITVTTYLTVTTYCSRVKIQSENT